MKLHLASFVSFLKTKRFPSRDDINAFWDSSFSLSKAIVLGGSILCIALFLSIVMHISALFSKEVPDYGGTITFGTIGAPRYINPLLANSETDLALASLVYAPLVQKGDDGSLKPVLATECVASPDAKSYQCSLPPTVTFSDKSSLTSADVAFTFETKKAVALRTDPTSPWRDIRVETPNPQSVVIYTVGSTLELKEKMTLGIVPKALWESIPLEALEDSTLNMAPIGAGAFIVQRIKTTSTVPTEVVLQPNPRWLGPKPYVHELIVKSYANQLDLKSNLRAKAITSTSSLRGTYTDSDIERDFSITSIKTNKTVSLFMNQQLLGNAIAARLAYANYFVDRKNIIDTIENGYGSPLFPSGEAPRSPTLSPISISIAVQKDDDLIKTADILSKDLEAFGILSTVNVFDQGVFTDQLHLGQYALVLVATTNETISGYQRQIPLYTKSILHIASPDVHTPTPAHLEFGHESLRDASAWYARTDKVWKWFK